jgi:hypothetical protein
MGQLEKDVTEIGSASAKPRFDVYCDESCHLENDGQRAMVLGAVWCSSLRAAGHAREFRALKIKHGLNPKFEIKWTKVSESKVDFYLALLEKFFGESDLHFRALLVPDKTKLDHLAHGQSHDDWYYKMHFQMLKFLISPSAKYRIFIDVKDRWGGAKVNLLHKILSNNMYDYERSVIDSIQIVRSHEFELLQMSDLLIGAVSYVARGLHGNRGKLRLVEFIRRQTGYSLTRSTLYREEKFNLMRWSPWEKEIKP